MSRVPALVVTALAVAIVGALYNPLAPACLAAVGVVLTVAAARHDRFLVVAALLAFAVRAGLAVVLQWIVMLDLDALRAVQETEPLIGYRSWIFALDSKWYHLNALQLLSAWRGGGELPTGTSLEYVTFVAVVYRLFGANPLNAMLCNAFFGTLAVVTGYRIAERVAGPTAARVTAVLIGAWPSAILWSTQLLKDAICLWLILGVLHLTIRVVEPPPRNEPRARAAARWMGALALLFAAALALSRYRQYVLLTLTIAPAAFIAHALVRRTRQTAWHLVAACIAMAVIFLGMSVARRLDIERLVGPADGQITRVKMGIAHHARGDLRQARAHYSRALELVAEYPPALKRLAIVAVAEENRIRAIDYFERYLAREPGDERVRAALAAIRARPEGASLRGIPLPDIAFDADRPTTVSPGGRPMEDRLAAEMGPYRDAVASMRRLRAGFARTGGHSTIDDVELRDYHDMLRYLPRAVANVFFVPYPWQWFGPRGTTGPFKVLSALEAIAVYVLIVPLVLGVAMVIRRGSAGALYLAAFVTAMAILLGLVISNAGTLFRLRLESLLPLFAAGSLGCVRLLRGRWRTA